MNWKTQILVGMFVVLVSLVAVQAEEWKFDFGKEGNAPHPGYTHVDPTTVYDAGAGYGIVDNNPTADPTSHNYYQSWQTDMQDLAMNAVGLSADMYFQVDVPNGDYIVNFGAGNPGWDGYNYLKVNGTHYDGDDNPENVRILDVAPDEANHAQWIIKTDLEIHKPLSAATYGFVYTWGADNNTEGHWSYCEILYLQDQQVTVTDGKLTFFAPMMNFIEVTTVPPPLLAGDANRDGFVSAGDYASVQSNFGDVGEPGIPGDANGDGSVSAGDYASVQANFGSALATMATPVPEPASMCILSLGIIALIKRRK